VKCRNCDEPHGEGCCCEPQPQEKVDEIAREQAEARALELYPNTHIATVNQLHEVSRDAFLQCWDEMQVPMNPQEAKERALELYPIHPEFDVDRLKPLREAYLQGWEDSQQDKQTCGFCVEPKNEEK
jgi:hypothetical protein